MVVVDKNVQQRLRNPTWELAAPVRHFLDTTEDVSINLTSVAIEDELSDSRGADFRRVLDRQNGLGYPLLRGPSTFTSSGGGYAEAVQMAATDIYVACAEVQRARQLVQSAPNKLSCRDNCIQFLTWRNRAYAGHHFGTSAWLCLTALAGGENARRALKLLQQDVALVRNGACDATHLAMYAECCNPRHANKADGSTRVALFITSDKALARAIPAVQAGYLGGRSVVKMMPEPFKLSLKRWEQLLAEQNAVTDVIWTQEALLETTSRELAVLFGGGRSVPTNITVLRNALRRFETNVRESKARMH
jgi:hypothetical protein